MNTQKIEVHAYFEYVLVDIDVMDDQRLTPIEKVTFLQLRRFASNQTSQCYPSIKKLAEKVNCSERAVQNALKKLEELHLIIRTPSFNGGRQTATIYTVIGHKDEYYSDKGGCTSCTPPCTSCTDGGAPDAPRTITIGTNNITLTREADLPNSTEPEKTNTAEIETEPQEISSPDNEKNQKNVVKSEVSNPEEHFAPKAAPSIMQPTARYLLQRTGREYLAWEEILALRELSASQMPARVQKEIDTACERFQRHGKPLSSLRFEYIASALRNQPTRGHKANKTKNKLQSAPVNLSEIPTCSDAEAEAEMAKIEEMQRKFDEEVQAR